MPFPYLFLFTKFNFIVSSLPPLSSCSGRQGTRLQFVHHMLFLSLLPQGEASFPCSSMGSLLWETIHLELLQQESFPWVTVNHDPLQHGSFSVECSPSGAGCFNVGSFYFLKCVISEASLPSLTGLALASGESVLESAAMGSVGHWGIFWQLLREPTSVAPSLPNPGHINPIKIQRTQIQGTASK